MSAPGYLIYQYRVTDRERVGELGPRVVPVLERHGGEIVIASHVEPLEGEPPAHVVVYRFASVEAARAFHDSPEHRELGALRRAATEGVASLVPGFTDRA